jgi:hypothetical protein
LELLRLKRLPYLSWNFFADDLDVSPLPGWVHAGRQITDGHLIQLAQAHSAVLATLDANIPVRS